MAKTYFYEYGGQCHNRTIDFLEYNTSSRYVDGNDPCCGSYTNQYDTVIYRASILSSESVADVAINVYYQYTVEYTDPWNNYQNTYSTYVTIPAGQRYTDVTFIDFFKREYVDMCPGGGCAIEVTQTKDVTLLDQPEIPSICNDPSCVFKITGHTKTNPTSRGQNDGSITVSTSGGTGNIIWKLNGITQPQTSFVATFSSLKSGNYIISAEDDGCTSSLLVFLPDGEFRTGNFSVTDPTLHAVAVENPVILTLRTALSSISPSYAVNTFQITGTITNVTIEFNLSYPYQYYAIFKSKAFPDRGNYFLESILRDNVGNVVGSNTTTEIATSLAEVFQKDAILSRLFFITNSGTTVTLKSKEYNSEFNLSSSNVTITGNNVTLTNTIPGVTQYDGQISPEYSLYGELYVNEDLRYGQTPDIDHYNRVIELELPYNRTNIHQFDFSSALKNFVFSNKLDFTFTGYTYLNYPMGNYFIKYGEKYPLIVGQNTKKKRYKGETGFGWFLNASLDYEKPNNLDVYLKRQRILIFGVSGLYIDSGFRFLNTAPNTKISNRGCKEFLSFIIKEDYGFPLALYANITLFDGTRYLNQKMYDIHTGTTYNGGIIVVNAGFADLGLGSYETSSKVRRVDLTIMQDGYGYWVPYSETKSYHLDIDDHCNMFNVAFLNSLGTYETYSFNGELIESQDTERIMYQRPYDLKSDGSAEPGFLYNATMDTKLTRKYMLNTGIIDDDTFYFLRGLLNSNRIYHYDGEYQNNINIINESAVKSSNDNGYSIQIEVIETININNVSS